MAEGPGDLHVKTEKRDDAVIVEPHGDIDLTASPSLRYELKRVQAERPPRLVVDLGHVSYMDSSGVATLVEAMQTARRDRTRMVLCAMQDRVRSIFEIAKLDTVFTITTTVDDALGA